MTIHLGYNRLLALCLIAVIRLQYSGVIAETMCFDTAPMSSPKMLTSVDYPAMVTAVQCQCLIIPDQMIDELDLHVQLRRSDRTTDCSRTQMAVVHRNISNIICPTVDGQPVSGGDEKNIKSSMIISLSLNKSDRPVITLWNTHLDFINVQVILTSEHPVPYNIVCTNLEGSLYWPYDDQGLGFNDGIDAGIKVAVVVLFFILVVMLSASVRLMARLRLRRAQFESKKQQATLKRISKLKQAVAFDNPGFSSSTLNHSSTSTLILQNYEKPRHTGNLSLFPTADSTSRSTVRSNDIALRNIIGHGSVWPLAEEEPRRPMVNRPTYPYTQDMSNRSVPDRTSKPVRDYYASDVATAGSREKSLSNCYQTPSASSQDSQTAAIGYLASKQKRQRTDAIVPILIGSEEEKHGRTASPSDVFLATVHQREPGKSWQKNSRTAMRKLNVENNGQQRKTIDNDHLLSISSNTTTQRSRTPTPAEYDTFSRGGNHSTTNRDRTPRESAI